MRFVLLVGLIACAAPAKPIAKVTNLAAPVDELVAAVIDDRVAPQIAAEITASLVTRPRAEIDQALARRRANLSDVLIQRIETSGNDLEARGWFAHSLSIWDPERGDPILARETRRALIPGSYTSEGVVLMTERRIERNDPAALVDYASWLLTLPPTRNADELFSIVADHQTHPKIALAASWVFRVGSPWLAVDDEFTDRMRSLLRGKSISIPALNLSIETALADRTLIGKLPQLRVADYYAWMLAANEGAPAFKPTWPIALRDAAIAKIRAWVLVQRGTWKEPPPRRHLIF